LTRRSKILWLVTDFDGRSQSFSYPATSSGQSQSVIGAWDSVQCVRPTIVAENNMDKFKNITKTDMIF